MTPAIQAVQQSRIGHVLHEYQHDPAADSYGLEAAKALGVAADRVFKTLITALDGTRDRLAAAIVPASKKLDMKAVAKAAGAKKAEMADPKEAERATGYVVGGISPLGQRKRLPTLLDHSASNHQTIFVSAGKRGLQIELSPQDLVTLTGATLAAIAR
jgi:Cys-tRNA(Pro)/Cys-tRNA(Cys) deacylase